MKESAKAFLRSFIPGFLATVLGILLTFGVDSWNSARKRQKTAQLLAGLIVGKMDTELAARKEILNIKTSD